MSFLLDDRVTTPIESVRLPEPPEPARASPFPFIAAFVPLVGAVGMWLVTGSAMMLWFAALSPVMLVGAVVDRRRARRRDSRAHRERLGEAVAQARAALERRHGEARAARASVHPSLAELCEHPGQVWRVNPQRDGTVAVGRGAVVIASDVTGGGDDVAVLALRELASRLDDAPVVIPLDGGIALRGPRTVTTAIGRALLLQVCAVHPPGRWRVLASAAHPWTAALPHTAVPAAHAVALIDPAAPPTPEPVDVAIHLLAAEAPVPPGCTTVIDVDSGLDGRVTRGSMSHRAVLEAVSARQADDLARALARRAARLAPPPEDVVRFADLPATGEGTLSVAVGRSGTDTAQIDLAADGPHAVVVGTTGAGKSEFLVTWVLALCRAFDPTQVTFMLADFKGGTAFEPLAALPHVVGVLTDLDPALADRAVRSLAAEVRRRESIIARCGARDVDDSRVDLARLVVVVDEFPALLAQRPHLESVFTDIAARGRALGIHLVIGGQRVSGVVRDALLSNCPLRIALRVADAAESRGVVGIDDAATLTGGPAAAGVGFVRRAGDARAVRTRFALSSGEHLREVMRLTQNAPTRTDSPWLPPLPALLTPDDPRVAMPGAVALADDPDGQRQPVVLVTPGDRGIAVIGGPATGRSTALRAIAATHPDAVWLGNDPERAWDVIAGLDESPRGMLLCDDLDVLIGMFPDPWAHEIVLRLDALVRRGGDSGMTTVVSSRSANGAVGRLIDLLPRRAILAFPTRADHVAAGGVASEWAASRAPGRAMFDGRETQFVAAAPVDVDAGDTAAVVAPRWAPSAALAGLVTRAAHPRIARAAARWGRDPIEVTDLAAGVDLESATGLLLVGDPDQWQRAWQISEAVRRRGEFVVSAECAPELRALTGHRALAPYARAGRAWRMRAGEDPQRVRWE